MDDQLLLNAIRGDEQAILTLMEQDEEILYRTAFAYVKNEQDALDAMQELTYKALKKIHTVKEPKYVRTWLIRVLINQCKDILKKRPQTFEQQDKLAINDVYNVAIYEMLHQLTLSEQQLVYLKYFRDLKNKDIAHLTNLAEGTVKSKLHYILKKLRKSAGERSDWL